MRLAFLTGTRADWSKLRPLVDAVPGSQVIATGMHLSSAHGLTIKEVLDHVGRDRLHVVGSGIDAGSLPTTLASLSLGLPAALRRLAPRMLVVHGDRSEALAGAFAARCAGIPVGHVEGGERSGSIDDRIRDAVSILADWHFVANESAAERVRSLTSTCRVYVTGSPEIDTLWQQDHAANYAVARARYGIPWDEYGICIWHPVVGPEEVVAHEYFLGAALRDALVDGAHNWIVLTPNSDPGSEHIRRWVEDLEGSPRFRVLPSMRFDLFAGLLHHAQVIVGNSSCGIREAPVLATPAVNIGSRQGRRWGPKTEPFCDVRRPEDVAGAIEKAWEQGRTFAVSDFGDGFAAMRFVEALEDLDG